LQGQRYPLRLVVIVALMAMICGCDDAESMESWGEANEAWLAGFLPMPHGAPSQDVFLAVFAALDPKAFEAVLRSWASLLRTRLTKLETEQGSHIAIDGKTSRRSFDSSSGKSALHTVSAYLSDAGLVLGATKTDAKSNELTAIPELLRTLDLRGATVTIDAMGTHTEIAKTIVDGGANYLLCVKDNQPTLRRDIAGTFAKAAADEACVGHRSVDEPPPLRIERFEEIDKGHGRLERREVTICRDLCWLTTTERWPNLSFVVQVRREREDLSTGKRSCQQAWFIGSEPTAQAADVARSIRRHWSIENELHWVLDLGFREDEARHRAQNTAQNMTTLRHFALNIIKQDPNRKLGVANSRKRAGWDRRYLLDLIKGAHASTESEPLPVKKI
jgi:predicted transposase YbfD/YdcC